VSQQIHYFSQNPPIGKVLAVARCAKPCS
jgi:hypothetical protein